MPLACERCGRVDETLRFAVFTYVHSLVIVSFRRVSAAVLCSRCRVLRGWALSAVSLVVGPWGIPFGLFWTIQALWRNARGGLQPVMVNAAVLGRVYRQLKAAGQSEAAMRAWEVGQRLHPQIARDASDPATAATVNSALFSADGSVPRSELPWRPRNAGDLLRVAMLAGTVLLVGSALVPTIIDRSTPLVLPTAAPIPGGTRLQGEAFSLSLPPKWESFAMDPKGINASIAAFNAKYRSSNIGAWARDMLDQRADVAAVYMSSDALVFVPAVTLTSGSNDGGLDAVVADLVRQLTADPDTVKGSLIHDRMTLPAGAAEHVAYKVLEVRTGVQYEVIGYVLKQQQLHRWYHLRFELDRTEEAVLLPQIDAIAASLRLATPR